MKILSFCSLVLLTACVNVPETTIRVPTASGVVVIKAPKDSKIAGLKANFEKGTVTLDSYEAHMNPEVIGASAAGQVELIRAYGEFANGMANLGLRAFAASQGMPMAGAAVQPTAQVAGTITTDQLSALVEQRAKQLAALSAATNNLLNQAASTTNAPPPK